MVTKFCTVVPSAVGPEYGNCCVSVLAHRILRCLLEVWKLRSVDLACYEGTEGEKGVGGQHHGPAALPPYPLFRRLIGPQGRSQRVLRG